MIQFQIGKKLFILFVMLIALFGVAFQAGAQTIKVTTMPIPGLVVSETEGIFVKLYLETAKRAGVEVDLEVLPVKRARHLFETGKADSFFPALDASLGVDAAKAVFYIKKIFSFVNEGNPILTDIEQLEGKKVCLTRGFTYPRKLTLNENIKLDEATDPVQSIKKLKAGRCDCFVADPKVGTGALEKSGAEGVTWDPEKPLAEMDVYFAFKTDEAGNGLADGFTKALASMKEDGTFKTIMSGGKK
ncbi:MAG: transporter substrate-binding domain-containing protein [Desulfobacterales bacterium]|nr:transporter substrate-binding domain-containing protein [Desulfobacterales bacterium]